MLGAQFHTVLYYEDTGEIREILPNQYIKSRKHLNMFINMPESHGIKFFYVEGNFPIDPEFYKVRCGTKRTAPRLMCLDGSDPGLSFIHNEAVFLMKNYNSILVKFEGGMGDYMDQADVVCQLMKDFPNKKFSVEIHHANRRAALEMFDGWKGIDFFGGGTAVSNKTGVIHMDYISKVQGYSPGGKIGIYSSIGGLNNTAKRAKLIITDKERDAASSFIGVHASVKNPVFVILHTISGPANSKSIPPSGVINLLGPLLANKSVTILHIGGAGEKIVDHPQIVSLQGKLGWEKVFALMSLAHGCICIDSSIMHIAQHLNLHTVSLWGPTDPVDILGVDSGVTAIRTLTHCKGCGLWDCKKENCMINFDKKELAASFKKMVSKR